MLLANALVFSLLVPAGLAAKVPAKRFSGLGQWSRVDNDPALLHKVCGPKGVVCGGGFCCMGNQVCKSEKPDHPICPQGAECERISMVTRVCIDKPREQAGKPGGNAKPDKPDGKQQP